MADTSVKTGVDSLLELLKEQEKISQIDAAKKLGLTEETIKLWVEFLVEEKVIGVEYKFTKPYLYLNKPKAKSQATVLNKEEINISTFKKDFEDRAKQSSIPENQVNFLWKDHIINQLELEKPFFYRESRKRGLEDIDVLWKEYKEELTKG